MARNEVLRLGDGLVLDVQADLLDALNTRVVVPLMPRNAAPLPARGLNPVFVVDQMEYTMATQFLAAVPRSELGQAVGSLDAHHDDITRALDLLFQGI